MTSSCSPWFLAAICASFGCSSLDNCPTALAPITITTGKSDVQNQSFESAPWSGTLDAFPAKTELRFEHELGFTPLNVKAYLSFKQEGTNGADHGSVAESAGNQDLITCVDSHVIFVVNDTCEKSFYIRVTANGTAPNDLGDTCRAKMP